jgi:hypothetical protein
LQASNQSINFTGVNVMTNSDFITKSNNGPRFINILGHEYGRLTVIALYGEKGTQKSSHWTCKCKCGKVKIVRGSHLRTGRVVSCGCFKDENTGERFTTHGKTKSRNIPAEFNIWQGMIERCHNPSSMSFKNYGGRGIFVCDEWRNNFPAFMAYIGQRPSLKHSVDRINTNLGYQPGNVRWATHKEQARNTRTNCILTYNGESKCLAEWAEIVKIPYHTIKARKNRYQWCDSCCLTIPVRVKGIKHYNCTHDKADAIQE